MTIKRKCSNNAGCRFGNYNTFADSQPQWGHKNRIASRIVKQWYTKVMFGNSAAHDWSVNTALHRNWRVCCCSHTLVKKYEQPVNVSNKQLHSYAKMFSLVMQRKSHAKRKTGWQLNESAPTMLIADLVITILLLILSLNEAIKAELLFEMSG